MHVKLLKNYVLFLQKNNEEEKEDDSGNAEDQFNSDKNNLDLL